MCERRRTGKGWSTGRFRCSLGQGTLQSMRFCQRRMRFFFLDLLVEQLHMLWCAPRVSAMCLREQMLQSSASAATFCRTTVHP